MRLSENETSIYRMKSFVEVGLLCGHGVSFKYRSLINKTLLLYVHDVYSDYFARWLCTINNARRPICKSVKQTHDLI